MHSYRSDFPIFQHHPDLTYLDSAASTQKPATVIQAVTTFYEQEYATIHRGLYDLSIQATEHYEAVREKAAHFLGGTDSREIVFTRNATEGLNLLASCLRLKEGDEIILSELEHHANLVPWQQAAQKQHAVLRFCKLNSEGEIDLTHFESLINERTRLVSLSHCSNVLGRITPLREVKKILQRQGSQALLIADLSQSAPHIPLSVSELGCDFAVCSSHKLYGPSGVGLLWGRAKLLESLPPYQTGGEMISSVNLKNATWNQAPWKFEAGTPNIEGVIGLGAALDYLEHIGMEIVAKHTSSLTEIARKKLQSIPEITLLGNPDPRSGILSFTVSGLHPHDVADLLNRQQICLRAGHHCAEPLHGKLGLVASNRISLGLYNTETDLDRLETALKAVINDIQHV